MAPLQLQLMALLCLVNLSFSFAPCPLPLINRSIQYSRVLRPPSYLFAKSNFNWQPFFNDDKRNGMELGVQTAQLLLDKNRQAALKRELKTKFPMVPTNVMDGTIDVVAKSFATVAPSELRQALQPGGMAKMRPTIQKKMVQSLMTQSIIRDIPLLEKADKRKVCEAVVDLALDYALKDAQELLAAPEVRLEALNVKRQEIQKQMGWKKLIIYRIRHNPRKVALAVIVSAFFLYQQRKVPVLLAIMTRIQKTASASLISFWNAAHVKFAASNWFTLKKTRARKTLINKRRY